MKKIKLLTALLFFSSIVTAQSSYRDSLNRYIQNYIAHHEVVKGGDKQYFQFYKVNPDYRVVCRFEKVSNSPWFKMATSGSIQQVFRIYGKAYFTLHDTAVVLPIYQSQSLMQNSDYQNYLFIPFTDATSGYTTYESGRYMDITIDDIKGNTLVIDFNKAYNPYCAYDSHYSCPIPPKESRLAVAILAGEKKFGKQH